MARGFAKRAHALQAAAAVLRREFGSHGNPDKKTLVKVNCCDALLHGTIAEVNVLALGNDLFRVKRRLKPTSVYLATARFDEYDSCDGISDADACDAVGELVDPVFVCAAARFKKKFKEIGVTRAVKRELSWMLQR